MWQRAANAAYRMPKHELTTSVMWASMDMSLLRGVRDHGHCQLIRTRWGRHSADQLEAGVVIVEHTT